MHCFRREDEVVSDFVLLDSNHGTAKVGRPIKTYLKLLTEDHGIQVADLPNAVDNRELWREIFESVWATRPI